MAEMKKMNGESLDIVEQNIEQLKTLFPEAFNENGINFETLRQLLGDKKVLDEGEEKYGMNWHGKKQAHEIALTPSLGTLLPCKDESMNWDTTQNLFIEGDNLEVLKILQRSYANKVKIIYIDPPYNTGNEFIYPDKYEDNLNTYLKYTGQVDRNGTKFSSNTETGGRKHTNWLNMMYPRLKLAKNILRNDGIIFISIDDNEQANLKKLCDEIFGEENFVGIFIKQSKIGGGSDSKYIVKEHEYVICFAKAISNLNEFFQAHDKEYIKRYKEKDNTGRYFWDTFARPGLKNPIKYEINAPDGSKIHGEWIRSKARFDIDYKNGDIRIIKKNNGKWSVQFKQRLNLEGKKPRSMTSKMGGTIEGKNAIVKLFDEARIFSYPKPPQLMKFLCSISDKDKESIILDFFAGSATTAQAIMQLNAEDGGNRSCISVQLPEPTNEKSEAYKAGYKNIATISKERIRLAVKEIRKENPDYIGDLGFKAFKLASSNIKAWNPNYKDLKTALEEHVENLVEERSEEDLLYELLLKRGVDLTVPIEERKIKGKTVYSISKGKIIACLDESITDEDVEELVAGIIDWYNELKESQKPEVLETHAFFRDSAFSNDIAKTNVADILSQRGIDHVRSL